MSDYQNTWLLRQRYYSPSEVENREFLANEAELDAEQNRLQGLAEQQKTQHNVFGGTNDMSHLFRRNKHSSEGSFSGQVGDMVDTAKTLPILGEELVEHAGEAVPSIGAGLINATGNVIGWGAHVAGLEDEYAQFTNWANRNIPIYQPEGVTGQVVEGISQVMAPFGAANRMLQAARVSNTITRIIAAGGITEGMVFAPEDDNLGDILLQLQDAAPEFIPNIRGTLIDALAMTPKELEVLHQADVRKQLELTVEADVPMVDEFTGATGEFDVEAYREAYFNRRLKAAAGGMLLEGTGETIMGLVRGTRLIYRTAVAMKDPTTREAAMQALGNALQNVGGPSSRFGRNETGSITPFLELRTEQGGGTLDQLRASSEAMVASPVEAAKKALDAADAKRTLNITHPQLAAMFPPEVRRASPLTPGQRHTTVDGKRFSDLNLEAKGASVAISDDDILALWGEAIEFMQEQGYDAQSIIANIRGQTNAKTVFPKEAAFWKRSLESLPNRARYWYEISAEGMRDMLPDLTDEEFGIFVDIVAMTSQSAAPTQNMMRAIGVLSHTLRDIPSEQDVIDPATLLRSFGEANQGLKVGSFGGTFLHHLGLRDMPQLSTNDRQVASTFGMGPTDIAQNPVMYGVLSRFYQNLRDHLNGSTTQSLTKPDEPWETWQLQAMGWVQERIEKGNTDFDDYLDVMTGLGLKAQAAGLPTGPNGELTRATLMDPRLDPLMATTIEEYRRKQKVGLSITGRGPAWRQAQDMMREFELMGDTKAVQSYQAVQRRALKNMMHNRSEPIYDEEGNRVYTPSGEKASKKAVSPAALVASALMGKKQTISRTSVGVNNSGLASRIPLPANVSDTELKAWLSTMGQASNQPVMRAGRFNYLSEPPKKIGAGHATSVLYQNPEPLTPEQVLAFQQALGSKWQVDAHVAPNGTVMDVHPVDGQSATADELAVALEAAGLSHNRFAKIVYSNYDGVSVSKDAYSKNVAAWRSAIVRSEAYPLRNELGGSRAARAIIEGKQEMPEGLTNKIGKKVESARKRVAARFDLYSSATDEANAVVDNLEADSEQWIEQNTKRLANLRKQHARVKP
tara:strand:- start:8649 stop:11894 length:3246 start_codon:yes stop_codon:yes gene_type:complete